MKTFSYYFFAFSFSQLSFAHTDHDWREDIQAFKQVKKFSSMKLESINLEFEKIAINFDYYKVKLAQLSGLEPITINQNTFKIVDRYTSINRDFARLFLKYEFEKIGFEVQLQNYGNGINFVAEKKGTTDKILIISSHLDTVKGVSGANDAESGVISALTIAEAIKDMNFEHTIHFVFFDQEESGLLGSSQYVKKLLLDHNPQNIIGDIQLEMIGANRKNDGKFHVIDCGKSHSTPLTQIISNAITNLDMPLEITTTCTERSDHASFWKKNLPAIVVSENFFGGDADPCYHKTCDTFDSRLNLKYIENITATFASVVAYLLKAP